MNKETNLTKLKEKKGQDTWSHVPTLLQNDLPSQTGFNNDNISEN